MEGSDPEHPSLTKAPEILKTYRFSNPPSRHVDAIPDAPPHETPSCAGDERLVPVSEIVGVAFPSSEVCEALVQSYLDSMHWYLTVVDEDSLRARLEPIFRTGLADARQKPLVMLGLIVLVIGIDFLVDKDPVSHLVDLTHTKKVLAEAAQKEYLSAMEQPTVDSVAFSFLLAGYYLCARQPNLFAITMDATMNTAQDIGLHQESTWGAMGFVERQFRRHIWWSVFTGSTYVP